MLEKILELLRAGKTYQIGHYQAGYTYLSYDKDRKVFIELIKDHSVDIYNPSVTETLFTETQFKEFLLQNFKLDEILKNLSD